MADPRINRSARWAVEWSFGVPVGGTVIGVRDDGALHVDFGYGLPKGVPKTAWLHPDRVWFDPYTRAHPLTDEMVKGPVAPTYPYDFDCAPMAPERAP